MAHWWWDRPGSARYSVTSDYTVPAVDGVVSADASGSSPLIVTLPPAPTSRSIEITVANVGATGTVTVDASGAETIEGALTYNMTTQWDAVTLESVSGGWIIGGGGGGGGGVSAYSDTVPNLGVTTYQGAIESLMVGAPSTSFVFNSSGIQGGTRYNNWDDLTTALANNRYGGPRNIVFEQSETLNAAAGAVTGAYDLTDITLVGNSTGYGVNPTGCIIVTLPTGFTITNNVFKLSGGIAVESTSVNPIMTLTAPTVIDLDESSILASTTAPFAYIAAATPPGVVVTVAGYESSQFMGAAQQFSQGARPVGGYELFSDDSGGFWAQAPSPTGSRWDDDLFRCSAGAVAAGFTLYWYVVDAASQSPGGFGPQQSNANLSPGYTQIEAYLQSSNQMSITLNGSTGLWVGSDPTTTADAVDRLAVAVSTLIGGAPPNIP